jgi:hypothetical protein
VGSVTPPRYRSIAWRLGRGLDRSDPWTRTHATDFAHDEMDEATGWPVTLCGVSWPHLEDGRWAADGGLGFIGVGECRRCFRKAGWMNP